MGIEYRKDTDKVDQALHVIVFTLHWYCSLGIFTTISLFQELFHLVRLLLLMLSYLGPHKGILCRRFLTLHCRGVALQISCKFHLRLKLCAFEHAFCMEAERLKESTVTFRRGKATEHTLHPQLRP